MSQLGEEACVLATSIEHAARLQLLCRGAGYTPIAVDPDLAAGAKHFMTSPKFVQATFDHWCRRTLARHPGLPRNAVRAKSVNRNAKA